MSLRSPVRSPRPLLAGAAAAVSLVIVSSAPALAAAPAKPARWAHPRSVAPALAKPQSGSATVTRLHLKTEDGFPEVYAVVATHGTKWVRVRIPARPNGSAGWVRRTALKSIHVAHEAIVVSRTKLRATLYVDGHRVWSARVGVGAPATPTPAGKFWIREIFRVQGNPLYGPYALGTSAYSVLSDWPGGGVVGLHGTNEPALIPGRPSHGCVRLRNRDVAWLATHVPVGTPVTIE